MKNRRGKHVKQPLTIPQNDFIREEWKKDAFALRIDHVQPNVNIQDRINEASRSCTT